VLTEGSQTKVSQALHQVFGDHSFETLQVETVGPKVGKELRLQAVGAVLISIIFILIYVWFRFEFEFAPGAIVALVHDALAILAVFSMFQIPFDLSIVAAVLTIVGYSINDTIVLFDRVRENIKLSRDPSLPAIINLSINQTLSRTILTSGTVLFASLPLMFLGGPITFNFALAFTIGIVVGTYSSSFVASPITIYVRNYLQHKNLSS
jgi:preprotein translocase SecF subunit